VTPTPIRALLSHPAAETLARVVLTFPFWGSGFDKLVHTAEGLDTMRAFGLEPAWLFLVATVAVQIVGSALVVTGRMAWLGAGALGVFTVLTIPIAHHFWAPEGAAALHAFHTAAEHVGMVGGLVAIAALSARPRAAAEPGPVPMPQIVMAR
jgi:transmembrane protein